MEPTAQTTSPELHADDRWIFDSWEARHAFTLGIIATIEAFNSRRRVALQLWLQKITEWGKGGSSSMPPAFDPDIVGGADVTAVAQRRWVANNREYVRRYMRQWRAENPEKVAESNRRYRQRRARKAAAGGGR